MKEEKTPIENFKVRVGLTDGRYHFDAHDFCKAAGIVYPWNLEALLQPDEYILDDDDQVLVTGRGLIGLCPKLAKYSLAREIAVALIENAYEQTLLKSN